MQLVVGWGLAAVLGFAAASKLASPRATRDALATFDVPAALRTPLAATVAGAELTIAVGVVAGSDAAAYAGAALLSAFGVAVAAAVVRGRSGAPCGCFGARSRISPRVVVGNVALALAFASLPWLPERLSRDGWLTVGLAVALLGLAALLVVTLALAREVGALRLAIAPDAALEVSGEGPPLGERSALIERFALDPGAVLALAVFASESCFLCRRLQPAVEALGRNDVLSVEVFDEVRDADVWAEARAPGSPYAVALDRGGVVRAKGTFNTRAQLEGLLATAEQRLASTARG